MIPVTVDDLAANGLLGEADPQTCWERSVETLTARKDDIAGLAVASDERIEAYVLYLTVARSRGRRDRVAPLVRRGRRSPPEAAARRGCARGACGTCRFSKVHPAEISTERLESLGFQPRRRASPLRRDGPIGVASVMQVTST